LSGNNWGHVVTANVDASADGAATREGKASADARFRAPAATAELPWQAIAEHLAAHSLRLDLQAQAPRQFVGGLANLNFLVHLDTGPAVLRAPPAGPLPKGAHDMRREHRILSRLWRALPVAPRSFHLCEDETVCGRPFVLIDYRPGIVLTGDRPAELDARPDAARHLGHVMIDTLADIHAVDPAAVDLADLGRPAGFLQRALDGWIARAEACAPDGLSPAARKVVDWLRAQPLPTGEATLLHNDVKLDNLILDPATFDPVAVVDWDQGTLGDPLFDLATLLSYWTEPGDPPAMHQLAQMPTARHAFPSRREAVARYAARTGRDIGPFRFHRVLALLKLAVIFQQLHQRSLRDPSAPPEYGSFGALGEGILGFAGDVVDNRYF
jgi:aminoglycoside phosphotransferase (APT) family kinase protein